MLNPLSSMLIYSFVFSIVFGAAAPVGDPSGLKIYSLYLLCGILPWGFFTLTTNLGMASITVNAGLVRKVAFARETLVISQVIFCFVQFSIEMGLLALAMLFFGSHFLPWLPIIILHMLLLAIFASGIALALAASSVYFRDLRYLWTIVIQVMFFATPIIYSPDRIEGKLPGFVNFLWEWNPAKVFVMQFRHMLYSGASPNWGHFGYLAIVSAISLVAGWSIFQRLSRRIAEEL